MQYGVAPDGLRVEAARGLAAACPISGQALIPKCGRIVVHHWAHSQGSDCDDWYEPETAWHRAWKAHFPSDQIEVPFGAHRADIVSKGVVIELQNSPISPTEIEAREQFYRQMIWIVNAEKFAGRFLLMKQMGADVFSFRWKQMKSSWRYARRPVYFDFGTWTVAQLRGATVRVVKDGFRSDGTPTLVSRLSNVRYVGSEGQDQPGAYSADGRFEHLPTELLGRSLMRKYSLHENGFGSVVALDRAEFLRECGARVEGNVVWPQS